MSQTCPKCRKCSTQSVLVDYGAFTPKTYFYCRSCKVEVDDWGYEVKAKPKAEDAQLSIGGKKVSFDDLGSSMNDTLDNLEPIDIDDDGLDGWPYGINKWIPYSKRVKFNHPIDPADRLKLQIGTVDTDGDVTWKDVPNYFEQQKNAIKLNPSPLEDEITKYVYNKSGPKKA